MYKDYFVFCLFRGIFAKNTVVMEEIWKPVVGYEGIYEVSNFGRVLSIRKNMIMKLHDNNTGKGYKYIWGHKDGNREKLYVHIIVAQTFLPNPDNLPEVNHIDENPSNNRVDNLEWCTHKYNCCYSNEKEILRFSKDGAFIDEWPSMLEIERTLKMPYQSVSACCRGVNKTCYGFIFKYKEPQVS